ncbi:hypothetical protein OAE72_00655 [Akkermansiaceae bacterium]|nr:hypothetical protein [Akkermansiaceae bacterium]
MTYLQLVNSVLRRLRENEVTTAVGSADGYTKLIGDFVNDAKRIVEDSWDWSSLRNTFTVNTVANTSQYNISGTGTASKTLDVINDTSNFFMRHATSSYMNSVFLNSEPPKGAPNYYAWNGFNGDGYLTVDVFPIPDGVYTLRFNMVDRTAPFTADATVLDVPSAPVIQYAVALASRERGETGGTSAQELYALADATLADAIAMDAARFPSETVWTAC